MTDDYLNGSGARLGQFLDAVDGFGNAFIGRGVEEKEKQVEEAEWKVEDAEKSGTGIEEARTCGR